MYIYIYTIITRTQGYVCRFLWTPPHPGRLGIIIVLDAPLFAHQTETATKTKYWVSRGIHGRHIISYTTAGPFCFYMNKEMDKNVASGSPTAGRRQFECVFPTCQFRHGAALGLGKTGTRKCATKKTFGPRIRFYLFLFFIFFFYKICGIIISFGVNWAPHT